MKKTKTKIYFSIPGLIFLSLFFGFVDTSVSAVLTAADCSSYSNNSSAYIDCLASIQVDSGSSVDTSCSGGFSGMIYNSNSGACECPAPTVPDFATNSCQSCDTGAGYYYDSGTQSCQNSYPTNNSNCPAGQAFNVATNQCETLLGGTTNTDYQLQTGGSIQVNIPMTSSAGILPAGTTVDTATGVATQPDGTTVQLNSTDFNAVSDTANGGSNLTMCANGILYTTCDGVPGGVYAGSNYPTGSAFTVLGSNTNAGGLPTVTGPSGTTTSKCGVGFEEVSGVCFPLNTGLSNTSIYGIMTNLFSWLMGLFTTFAVLAFVLSGVQYLTAAGNEDLIKTAKSNATNAILGIIVGLSGFIVVRAIAAALSGQSWFF